MAEANEERGVGEEEEEEEEDNSQHAAVGETATGEQYWTLYTCAVYSVHLFIYFQNTVPIATIIDNITNNKQQTTVDLKPQAFYVAGLKYAFVGKTTATSLADCHKHDFQGSPLFIPANGLN